MNWGSSTQAQTYKTALASAQKLNNVGEHVKNYKPQVLVLAGLPRHRPSLLDFAHLITKNHSLLIVGDIIEVQPNLHFKTLFDFIVVPTRRILVTKPNLKEKQMLQPSLKAIKSKPFTHHCMEWI